ncbi:MAG: LysR family transcriptional regulator [Proteobacteria bacterium]|nr:LysR family transcriptional regulator [Pseudomonadota bacterium]
MSTRRQRPLNIGPLRAFVAVARLASFRAAGEELHLTQPAISRQIRALEDEIGSSLFLRGTRHVELTAAGATLLASVEPWLQRLDAGVQQVRRQGGRQRITVTTFASFATLWLIPRLQDFQRRHPDVDIRVSAGDAFADADDPETDLALRYAHADQVPPDASPMFDEVLTPAVSPALRDSLGRPWVPADLAQQTLLEEDDHRASAEFLSWHHWLRLHAPPGLEPRGWIYLNYTHQQIQGALAGQGVALARVALVHETLARGELVEPFGAEGRIGSPFGYWLLRWRVRPPTPHLLAFEEWVLQQAAETRTAMQDRR